VYTSIFFFKKNTKTIGVAVFTLKEEMGYCTISIYSVRPCDRDTFDGFGNSVLTIDYRDIKEISVDRVIDLVNLWVTLVNI
jgi:hypothetical protein